MKGLAIKLGIVACLLLVGGAANAQATEGSYHANGVYCQPGGGGVVCVAYAHTTGYGVGISGRVVMVMNIATRKIVFERFQPGALG
jgi:hypothetical protein